MTLLDFARGPALEVATAIFVFGVVVAALVVVAAALVA